MAIKVPYATQYRLLTEVQTILEGACFDFANLNYPEILERKGWDCPESIELNLFMRDYLLSPHGMATMEGPVEADVMRRLAGTISAVRHAAVHRHRLTPDFLERMFRDCSLFLRYLHGEATRAEKVEALSGKVTSLLAQLDKDTESAVEAIKAEKIEIEGEQRALVKRKLGLPGRENDWVASLREQAGDEIRRALVPESPDTPVGEPRGRDIVLLLRFSFIVLVVGLFFWVE